MTKASQSQKSAQSFASYCAQQNLARKVKSLSLFILASRLAILYQTAQNHIKMTHLTPNCYRPMEGSSHVLDLYTQGQGNHNRHQNIQVLQPLAAERIRYCSSYNTGSAVKKHLPLPDLFFPSELSHNDFHLFR